VPGSAGLLGSVDDQPGWLSWRGIPCSSQLVQDLEEDTKKKRTKKEGRKMKYILISSEEEEEEESVDELA
jgi:hypothetical protein